MNSRTALDRDAIIEQLSRLDSSDSGDAATDQPPSTVRELKAELDTLLGQLREPVEPDPFADETGLRRAQELVLAIGREPESKTPDHRPELGRIGPYELLEKLGEGGMGAVYKALHSSLEKIVALKVLPRERLNPQAISRFKREMKAVGKLDHPNIVRATDAGEADGDHFLVMEYVDGVDLAELLRRVGPLPAAEACELVRQAAVGLQHAHQRGMVHRDIKPNNIMLAWSDEHAPAVKILDMGLALLNEQKGPAHGDLTTTGQMMGTLEYMSPEQGLDTHNVDIRADIYSLGATLYKLLCGKAPFSGERFNTPGKLMVALATQTPPSIGTMRDNLPAGLVALVDRMLAREPAARPATPAEVAQALAPFATGADVSRLANTARQHGTSSDKTTEQSITPTELHLSSPSTDTSPTLKPGREKAIGSFPHTLGSARASTSRSALRNPHSALRHPKWLVAIAAGLLALAAGVFGIIKISTPDGDYVIQTDDPDFSFSVSKGIVTLRDKKTKHEYTMKVVREDNGVFELDVTDVGADLSFKTKEFTIKRGQQVALKAHFERKPTDVVNAPPSGDPDRRAAEWVLSIGGGISITENGQERHPRAVGDLPRGAFELTFVSLEGNQKVSNAGLAHFKDCQNLTQLHLAGTPVSDAGLAHFKDCQNLTHLWLPGNSQVSDVGLAHFKGCKNMMQLHLGFTQVSDLGLAHFKDCKNLTGLAVTWTKVSDVGLTHFKDCKNLMFLALGGTLVSDAGLAQFKDRNNLTRLDLHNTQVSDAGLAHFKDCKNLEHLDLHDTKASDAGLAYFKDCKNLAHLSLSGILVTDAGLAHFQDCKNLAHLSLSRTLVSDAGLAYFQNCKNLTDLHLANTQVSDAGLNGFAGCPKLGIVDVKKTKVTEAGVKKLSAALPGCKIEWDGGVIEPTVATDPDRRAAEWVLSVGGWVRVNDQDGDIKVANDLPREPFRLTQFDLSQCQAVTDAGLAVLKDCKNLTSVNLVETQLTDAGLVHFKDYPQLQELSLAHTSVTDAGLVHFQNCKDLKLLWLGVTQVSDIGLSNFQGCNDLTQLWLGGTKLTDAGLIHFKDCKDLTNLSVMNTKVTDVGLANFQDRKKFTHLWLGGTQLTDLGLSYLQGCENLTLLWLEGTKLTDAGLVHFKDCKELSSLSLDDTQVTDAGLAHFRECKKLTHVWLGRTQASETGLANFRDCKDLTELYLTGTLVGDTGLNDFAKFANLSYIDLTKTKVTEAGVKKLSAALPECKIEWDGGVIEPTVATNPDRRAAE